MKDTSYNEITLTNLKRFIKHYRYRLLIAPFILTAIAAILILQLRPNWEAVALIKLGNINGQLPNPITVVLSRIKSPEFRTELVANYAKKYPKFPLSNLSIEAKYLYADDLLEIKARSKNKEITNNLAVLATEQLLRETNWPINANIKRKQNELRNLNIIINKLESQKNLLEKDFKTHKRLNSTTEIIFYAYLNDKRDSEISMLQKEVFNTEEQLNSDQTFTTHLNGSITDPRIANMKPTATQILIAIFFTSLVMCSIFTFLYISPLLDND